MLNEWTKTEYRVARVAWLDQLQMAVFQTAPNGVRYIAKPPEMEELKPAYLIGEPTFRLEYEQGQQLIDELWRAGLRPSEGSGSAGSLRATENHLSDMRRIAFGTLKISSPESQP